jgi:hypothetical protein
MILSKREKKAIEKVQNSLYQQDYPIKILSKDKIKINESGIFGSKEGIITRKDLRKVDLNSANNGYVKLGQIVCDIRTANYIVNMCIGVFELIDREISNREE